MSFETDSHTRRSKRLSLLTTGLALLITFVLLVAYQFVSARQHLHEELHTEAAIIGASSSAALVFSDAQAAKEILATIRLTPRIIGAALYRTDGEKLAVENDAYAVFPERITSDPEHFAGPHTVRPGVLSTVMLEYVLQGDTWVGTLLLHVSYEALYWRLLEYAASVLLIGLIALAMTYYFTIGLRQRMTLTEEQLERMAFYDRVTGLPNRRFFEQELKKALLLVKRELKPAALLFIDVDNFKKINDLCGHQAGDQVLQMIAQRLRRSVRAADLIARVGGDEFVVILQGIGTPDNAAKVAEDMLAAVAEPFPTEPTATHVGLSIGITMTPGDGDDADTLLQWADMAMYVAKSHGKNRYQFFSEEINRRVHADLQIEADLRRALKDAAGGLFLVYQPQVCTRCRRFLGAEALIRWRRDDGQLIAPGDFIPIAENSGLIVELGAWVTRRVCEDLAQMRQRGVELAKVAINVSPRELTRGNAVVDAICTTLAQFGEPRQRFQYELTENALMDRNGSEVLESFHSAGFSLAIDDFGSGYSSLGYLKRFQVSALKIDRQFVNNLPNDSENAAIVSAVIPMARALGIGVVAEGVESEAQAQFLSLHRCDVLQGYLVSQPLPRDELVAFVHDDARRRAAQASSCARCAASPSSAA